MPATTFSRRRRSAISLLLLGFSACLGADPLELGVCPRTGTGRGIEVAQRQFVQTPAGWVEARPDSAACMECHDGSSAPAVRLEDSGARTAGGWSVEEGASSVPGNNHPVNVPYPDHDPSFVPRDRLDPAVRLVDGRVVCGTCHPYGTTLSNDRDRLCLSCHVK